MPLYEYRCTNCQARFEVLRPMSECDTSISCPHCTETGARRVISTFAAISKSNGSSRLVAGSQSSGCASCGGGHCATCGH